MRRRSLNTTLVAGTVGFVLGSLVQAGVNRWSGAPVLTDAGMWGAVLAIVAASVPNFVRMGSLTVRSDKKLVNLGVGLIVFLLISTVVVVIFYAIFSVLERLLT